MKQIKVAILGQGRSGRNIHGSHILKDERFRVVAVADPIEGRRERAKREYEGCEAFSSYKELFGRKDIDIVVNATPSQYHFPVAVDLMRHGFNVLQEKPIAATAAETKELKKVIEETGAVYAIFLQSRYDPKFVKVREIVDSGVLGRIICVKIYFSAYGRRWDWQTIQANVAGSLYNTGPHPVGQALEFLNCYDSMPEVYCKMDRVNTYGDAEDFVKLILSAPGRPMVDVEISSSDAYVPFVYHVQGDRGTLAAGKSDIRWKYFKEEEAPEQRLIREPLADAEGKPLYCSESLKWYEEKVEMASITDNVFSNATHRLYTDVYERLVNGRELPVTLKQVSQQIAVMEEAHRQNPLSKLF